MLILHFMPKLCLLHVSFLQISETRSLEMLWFVKTDMANTDLTQLYAMHAFDSSAQKKLNKIFSQKPKINSSPP